MAERSIPRNTLVEIAAEIDFVDMGDGTYILELNITYPLLVRARGKAGGMIFMAGQILFTPMPAQDARRMREALELMPGYPLPARGVVPPAVDNNPFALVDEEFPF